MAKRKKHMEPSEPKEEESRETLLSESLELDDILLDFQLQQESQEEAPVSGDTIRIDSEAVTEKLAELEAQREAHLPEPAKKGKRRGRKSWKQEKVQAPVTGDTLRLDRDSLNAALQEETVRFAIPESETAASRTTEGAETRVYPMEEHLAEEETQEPPRLEILEKKPAKSLEQRYEEAAMGLGGAQARLFCAGILSGVSLILTALAAFHVLNFSGGMSFLPFLQLMLLLLCALMAYDVVVEGIMKLFCLRPDVHTVLLVLLVFSLMDGVQCILEGRTSFGGLTSLCLTMALWADCQERSRISGTLDMIRRGGTLDGVVREPDYYQGMDGILRGETDPEAFLREGERVPGATRTMNIYSLLALAVAVILGVLTCGGSFAKFLRLTTGMLLAGLPALSLIAVSRPRFLAAQRLKVHGAVLCGWQGAKNLRGKLAVPMGDQDLFPSGNLRLNGMKLYPEVEPDTTIAYGAAAIIASDSGLSGVFGELRDRRNLRACKVQNLRRYDNGGISGEIGKDSVLAGSLGFMQAMGVEIPAGTQVNQAVYVAVNGYLGGVFALSYSVSKATIGALTILTRSTGVTPVLTAQDFVITPAFLHGRLRANINRIEFPSPRERLALAKRVPSENAKQCGLLIRPDFGALAKTVACGRAVYQSAFWGTVVSLVAGTLGLVITGILSWLGTLDLITAENLLLYGLLWSIPLWILGGLVHST